MIGLMGLLSETNVPGSVPFLAGIKDFRGHDGDVMAPFSHDFSLGTTTEAALPSPERAVCARALGARANALAPRTARLPLAPAPRAIWHSRPARSLSNREHVRAEIVNHSIAREVAMPGAQRGDPASKSKLAGSRLNWSTRAAVSAGSRYARAAAIASSRLGP